MNFSEIINEFIEIYDISDITTETWKSISLRLKQNVKNDDKSDEPKERYHTKYLDFKFENNKEFEGIIHHLIKETNGQIENEMKLTSSSTNIDGQLNNVINYNNNSHFRLVGGPNSWICFYFENHRINMTHYTIKSGTRDVNYENPKSWVIEGSNDNKTWEILDEQRNNSHLNGTNLVHTFEIEKQKQKEYKYIRMKQTDKNWRNDDDLMMSAFEIHGKLY